ncbi:hypothetical protein N431DRAFT_533711 [Stipitochalara longipes BDJ]|nr:hypothetical protein N431DRAFT_533711 [Stipitochalara longipes BDJ]
MAPPSVRYTTTRRWTSSTTPAGVFNTTSVILRLPPLLKPKTPSAAWQIDNLMWVFGWEAGNVKNRANVHWFRRLEEFLLVTRKLDNLGRAFRREFLYLEKGVSTLEEYVATPFSSKVYFQKCLKSCIAGFKKIKGLDAEWKILEVRFVRLKRDGVFV